MRFVIDDIFKISRTTILIYYIIIKALFFYLIFVIIFSYLSKLIEVRIFKKIVKSCFWIDVISIIPFGLITTKKNIYNYFK